MIARGTCSVCGATVRQRGHGDAFKHRAADGTACPGTGKPTLEWAELRRRRREDRARPVPDLPYHTAVSCSICGYLAWKPESHNLIHSIPCPGSPGGLPMYATSPLGPDGAFEPNAAHWIESFGSSSHGRSHLRDMQMRLADTYVSSTEAA
jgi:hypothetical protein